MKIIMIYFKIGCTEEKLQDYYDRFLKIETDVSNLNNTIQVEIKDLNTNIIPKVKVNIIISLYIILIYKAIIIYIYLIFIIKYYILKIIIIIIINRIYKLI